MSKRKKLIAILPTNDYLWTREKPSVYASIAGFVLTFAKIATSNFKGNKRQIRKERFKISTSREATFPPAPIDITFPTVMI